MSILRFEPTTFLLFAKADEADKEDEADKVDDADKVDEG